MGRCPSRLRVWRGKIGTRQSGQGPCASETGIRPGSIWKIKLIAGRQVLELPLFPDIERHMAFIDEELADGRSEQVAVVSRTAERLRG